MICGMDRTCLAFLRILWLACALTLATLPLRAADVTFIVNENRMATTVYLRINAVLLEPVFGMPPDHLWSETEALDYAALKARLDARAPELWPQLGIETGQGAVPATPMGMVMHPRARPVPFDTPLAASIAAAVCVTPTEPVAARPALDLYAGFVLRGEGVSDLHWALDAEAPAPVTVRIDRFDAGKPLGAQELVLAPGQQVALTEAAPEDPPLWPWGLGAGALALSLGWWIRRSPALRISRP